MLCGSAWVPEKRVAFETTRAPEVGLGWPSPLPPTVPLGSMRSGREPKRPARCEAVNSAEAERRGPPPGAASAAHGAESPLTGGSDGRLRGVQPPAEPIAPREVRPSPDELSSRSSAGSSDSSPTLGTAAAAAAAACPSRAAPAAPWRSRSSSICCCSFWEPPKSKNPDEPRVVVPPPGDEMGDDHSHSSLSDGGSAHPSSSSSPSIPLSAAPTATAIDAETPAGSPSSLAASLAASLLAASGDCLADHSAAPPPPPQRLLGRRAAPRGRPLAPRWPPRG
mmetsp:Transcript_46287/g.147005  ORF Transcript_46287/g.147005 Transcript_46287/m.147005 type:complete len:280 (-) Transcript_46287:73-912(-)